MKLSDNRKPTMVNYLFKAASHCCDFYLFGEAVLGLSRFGFGFIEVGSTTPELQGEKIRERGIVVGVNLDKKQAQKDAAVDYIAGVKRFFPLDTVRYFVINISSSNTPNLRDIQNRDELVGLLERVLKEKAILDSNLGAVAPKPILLKLALDLSDAKLKDISTVLLKYSKPDKNRSMIDGLMVMPLIHMTWKAEHSHIFAVKAAKARVVPRIRADKPEMRPYLKTNILGIDLDNPVGLAAGFDKDDEAVLGLSRFGFCFIEVGSTTPEPQPEYPLDTVSYIVINISSPNTPNLRDIQNRDELVGLLERVLKAILDSTEAPKLILLKLASDLSDAQLKDISTVLLKYSKPDKNRSLIDGLIVSNTTVRRPTTLRSPPEVTTEQGGLSGPPLRSLSTEVIRKLYSLTGGTILIIVVGVNLGKNRAQKDAAVDYIAGLKRFYPLDTIPIIGVGGVESDVDAFEKITAGASAVQLYTSNYPSYPLDTVRYINISSPNTPNLRDIQNRDELELPERVLKEKAILDSNLGAVAPKPILLKLAPDLSDVRFAFSSTLLKIFFGFILLSNQVSRVTSDEIDLVVLYDQIDHLETLVIVVLIFCVLIFAFTLIIFGLILFPAGFNTLFSNCNISNSVISGFGNSTIGDVNIGTGRCICTCGMCQCCTARAAAAATAAAAAAAAAAATTAPEVPLLPEGPTDVAASSGVLVHLDTQAGTSQYSTARA